jgi:hypothetical protein
MSIARAKAMANKTFTAQASLTIVTYDHQNILIVRATGWRTAGIYRRFCTASRTQYYKASYGSNYL